MKKIFTYKLYLLAKPGDERFFVFTRLPNEAWLKTQRENGFDLLETIIHMPERYNIDVDGIVASVTPETVKEEPEPTAATYNGYDLFRIRKSGKYYVYQNNKISNEFKRVFFEISPYTQDTLEDQQFPVTLQKQPYIDWYYCVDSHRRDLGILVRPIDEYGSSAIPAALNEAAQRYSKNKQAGVVTEISDDGTATVRPDSDPTHAQVGGDHYAKMAIQPEEYIDENDIGYHEGCVIKYVSRWKEKGGLEDLRKARHFLDLKIAREEKKALKK